MLVGFWLFFNSVAAVIEGVIIFFDVVNNYKYIRVFKLLAYLGTKAYIAVLPKDLRAYNLLLLKRPFYFRAIAFYKVFIEFLFKLSQDFKRGKVGVNK